MPSRILRDWTDSEPLSRVSANAERLFIRVIMKMDDYGCYTGDPRLIRANLFPLLVDRIREADVSCWIAECEKAGVVRSYVADDKQFLFIPKHGQRLRESRRKFPAPPAEFEGLPQSAATRGDSQPDSDSDSDSDSSPQGANGKRKKSPKFQWGKEVSAVIACFCELHKTRYGKPYQINGQDRAGAKAVVIDVHGDLEKANKTIHAFVASSDKFISDRKHSLSLLTSKNIYSRFVDQPARGRGAVREDN